MEENQDSMFKQENKRDDVKPPWQEEMEPGDFISNAPSYHAGKYFKEYEKGVMPCATVGDMTYYLYDPVKHGKDSTRKYPLLVFCHGATNALDGQLCINYCGGELYASEEYQESMGGGAYILIPMANEKRMPDGTVAGGWNENYIAPCMELIERVKVEPNNHISKTILFGNSSGGGFVWSMLLHDPDAFDGLVPMGARFTPTEEQIEMLRTKKIHLLLVHGRRDELAPFDECLAPVEKSLQKMGQHCIVNAVQSNLIYDNGKCYDERLPEGVTGWIRSILQ